MGAGLSLRQVRQLRGGREILRVDDLDLAPGEHISVLGPNGAGKTTLLRLLAGVDRPSSGTVTIDGVSTARGGVELRRRMAYATQQPGLLSTSVRRNVELPLRWRKVPRKERARLATAALERLRVAHLADRPAKALSGGERQRVNLARALALDPSVLLLDEPAAGLDAQTRSAFFADLEQALAPPPEPSPLADRSTTVVQVSHRAEEALRFAHRVVVLVDGRVHQIGTPDAVHQRPADASVAALVGYENLVNATVRPDGSVLVDGAPTGLLHPGPAGAATVAVFASGVRLVDVEEERRHGLPLRVARITPGPGHRVLALEGAVPLLAHLPIGIPAPSPGDAVRVVFDPARSAVLPPATDVPAALRDTPPSVVLLNSGRRRVGTNGRSRPLARART
ncbi:MAG: ATP-binding cassette domain-containing protein [Actinophytocola sp.]|nr:ATP-binding cassette domain-containing protein [Actinophytocola sp.]